MKSEHTRYPSQSEICSEPGVAYYSDGEKRTQAASEQKRESQTPPLNFLTETEILNEAFGGGNF